METTMTRSIKQAGLGAVMLMLASLAAPLPASAGGGVTLFFEPHGKDAQLVQQGLAIYSMFSSHQQKNHATVTQKGTGNAAAVAQKGNNNYGLVYQNGHNQSATVSQAGYNNALGVFQFGKNNNLDYGQVGANQTGIILQAGW
jgi:hypothetical protein